MIVDLFVAASQRKKRAYFCKNKQKEVPNTKRQQATDIEMIDDRKVNVQLPIPRA